MLFGWMCGYVGGWNCEWVVIGDQMALSISFFPGLLTSYGADSTSSQILSAALLPNVMSISSFKDQKFKTCIYTEKREKMLMCEKGNSACRKVDRICI